MKYVPQQRLIYIQKKQAILRELHEFFVFLITLVDKHRCSGYDEQNGMPDFMGFYKKKSH